MAKTSIFQSNDSKPGRPTTDVGFPKSDCEVSILRDAPRRVVDPANGAWDDFFDAPGIDLGARVQPEL